MTRDLYDQRPYTDHAYAETHPGRIAVVARMARWPVRPVTTARILELGCGRGGNLLPMAASLPLATLVGVDAAARPIDEARAVAAEAGLGNVTFVRARFDAMELDEGSFDYVICHGVASWISATERANLLERIARALAAGGVACVSFNVLPGWYDRLAARDWLRFAASSLGQPAEEAAASLRWLGACLSPDQVDRRRRLEAVARRLEETGTAYALHEYLAEEHHPLLVGAFLAEAGAAGLSYLGDAIPSSTALELLEGDARGRARALEPIAREQLVDFVRGTAFRRALLVRADGVKSWRASPDLDPDALRRLHLASRLRSRGRADAAPRQESFEEGGLVVQVTDAAARRALHELGRVAPLSLRFEELARRILPADVPEEGLRALASELFDLWLAAGGIDLLDHEPAVTSVAGERPVACALARVQARRGGAVTNRLHQEVLVPDAIVGWVLERLDGTRTRAQLAEEARALDANRATTDAELRLLVDAAIDRLVACALVVG